MEPPGKELGSVPGARNRDEVIVQGHRPVRVGEKGIG